MTYYVEVKAWSSMFFIIWVKILTISSLISGNHLRKFFYIERIASHSEIVARIEVSILFRVEKQRAACSSQYNFPVFFLPKFTNKVI